MNSRLPRALPLGLTVALALFAFMTLLVVEKDPWPWRDRPPTYRLEPVRLVTDPPDRPPPPPPPPTPQVAPGRAGAAPTPLAVPAPPALASAVALPALDIRPRLSGLPQTAGPLAGLVAGTGFGSGDAGDAGTGDRFQGKDLVPISSARPKYPRSAAARGIEGWVELVFYITPQGSVTDVRVLDASPRGVFEDAAVAAMARWVYAPFYRDGQPVMREATQRLEFLTADIQPLYIWED